MLKILWQKKDTAEKSKLKNLLITYFVHFLISLVCKFICNVNYNHDKDNAIEQDISAIFTKSFYKM